MLASSLSFGTIFRENICAVLVDIIDNQLAKGKQTMLILKLHNIIYLRLANIVTVYYAFLDEQSLYEMIRYSVFSKIYTEL